MKTSVCLPGYVPSLGTFYLCWMPRGRRLSLMWVLHIGAVEGSTLSLAVHGMAVSVSCLCGTEVSAQLCCCWTSHIPQLRKRLWGPGQAPAARQEGILGPEVLKDRSSSSHPWTQPTEAPDINWSHTKEALLCFQKAVDLLHSQQFSLALQSYVCRKN